jgi:ribonuclease P protein component
MTEERLSLKREQRIRSASEFQAIHRHGKFARGRFINLWSYRGRRGKALESESALPVFGVIVSRKVNRRASSRNLWKRRLREIFRKHQHRLRRGTAFLVQAKACDKIPAFSELETELLSLFDKTGGVARHN